MSIDASAIAAYVKECAELIQRLCPPEQRATWQIYAAEKLEEAIARDREEQRVLDNLRAALEACYGG